MALLALLSVTGMPGASANDFPIVPEDLAVGLYAKDPLVQNPCAITFDRKGRLCVGMGPQYRNPTPQTAGDSVYILIDKDGDGVADSRKQYATGFNSIQGLAWKGRDLWVANAPDLTIARDLDGDDEADEYIRVYTDLGNLEHGLHGLNWAPDGKLYMSKGNSKGLTQPPARVAPKAFRELWGVSAPAGTPDFPAPASFPKGGYKANYHDPADDWGLMGGILRCASDGSALEIVSRGLRNPWDIAYDDEFNWLGTDNGQTQGDKFIAPFYGAHFGWGHAWSFDWKGDRHLPTVPASGPLFEGSGTGVTFCDLPGYPSKYRGVFLVNDWLKRQVYIYRPRWDGALRLPEEETFALFADAGSGRSMASSSGRSFDPVDIEPGPDGAVWISSWGRQYGAALKDGQMTNEGRIYRFWPKGKEAKQQPAAHREQPLDEWHAADLISDLGSPLPVWRIDAREELIRRGDPMIPLLEAALQNPQSTRQETWLAWTLGSLRKDEANDDERFAKMVSKGGSQNLRIQALRILAQRVRERGSRELPNIVRDMLVAPESRLRHAAVLAIHQAGTKQWNDELLALAARESDRVVFYSTRRALQDVLDRPSRQALLKDERGPVRRAIVLGLLEEDALSEQQLRSLAQDADAETAALATKRLAGKAVTELRGSAVDRKDERRPVDIPALEPLVSTVATIQSASNRKYREARLEVGQLAYTDRRYRVQELPEELRGETFIQGANEDAEAEGSAVLTLNLRYPSTVYIADDERGGALPAWAADRFQPTDLKLRTNDARHRIYRAELPAGEVSFGANREGIAARKANYLIIIRPHLLGPTQRPTTAGDVAPLLARADAQRGRALFFSKSGAGCAACHRLEGMGNAFAPDLAEIGNRATSEFLIRSILEPSAEITEGFAMRVLTTTSGETHAGMLLEETAQAVKLGMAGGATAIVPLQEIAKRETLDISAMPAHFNVLLRPQDVADLVAYLASGGQHSSPRDQGEGVAALADGKPDELSGRNWGDQRKGFFLRCTDDRLEIALNGAAVATYYYRHPRVQRPFFANLKTRGGIQVTRNFPPVEGQDPTDHADLHPGLSMGFALLDGVNFWHNTGGKVLHEGFAEEPVVRDSATFGVRNSYIAPGGRVICREEARYRLKENDDGWSIEIETRFLSDKAFSFGVKEEMGLALRIATPIRVKDGSGTILSRNGGVNEKGTWGITDQWWDYFGPVQQRSVGVQIMSAPGNSAIWAHSRDYGVLVANPFPVDRAENRGRTTTFQPGETFTLRFGIQIHEHARREDFDPARSYQRYLDALAE